MEKKLNALVPRNNVSWHQLKMSSDFHLTSSDVSLWNTREWTWMVLFFIYRTVLTHFWSSDDETQFEFYFKSLNLLKNIMLTWHQITTSCKPQDLVESWGSCYWGQLHPVCTPKSISNMSGPCCCRRKRVCMFWKQQWSTLWLTPHAD